MWRYILKRLILAVVILVGVSVLIYMLTTRKVFLQRISVFSIRRVLLSARIETILHIRRLLVSL